MISGGPYVMKERKQQGSDNGRADGCRRSVHAEHLDRRQQQSADEKSPTHQFLVNACPAIQDQLLEPGRYGTGCRTAVRRKGCMCKNGEHQDGEKKALEKQEHEFL